MASLNKCLFNKGRNSRVAWKTAAAACKVPGSHPAKPAKGKGKGKGKGKSKAKKPCKYGRRRDGRCPPKPKAK